MEINRIYENMSDNGTKENLKQILETIAPYVIVTGSCAYGKQTEFSDIDMYVKELPEEEIDCESDYIEESYVRPLIRFFESLGYKWDSVFIDSFSVDDTFIPLEFSAYYDIEEETFPIEILVVKMVAAKSNHTSEKYWNGEKRNNL